MNFFELLIILDVTIPSEEARRIDVDKYVYLIVFCMHCKNICTCTLISTLTVLIKNHG